MNVDDHLRDAKILQPVEGSTQLVRLLPTAAPIGRR
jgi:hypothetical protein